MPCRGLFNNLFEGLQAKMNYENTFIRLLRSPNKLKVFFMNSEKFILGLFFKKPYTPVFLVHGQKWIL